ncbi:PRD domain-containing protein [Enterococcus casseliflavus]|uniref:PRD domain-containing protein n=1 Tax=Enterococcus casseliflavus TaxID=37734 RepID=UPI0022E23B4F|nr:PRD domain-containing protein [Enterococcus casseliflavus]
MKVTQSYNQNAVSVIDDSGKELILIGKGIGFGKKKGDVIDIRKASKIFRYYFSNYEKKVIDSLVDIPEEILLMAEEITVGASDRLQEKLNPGFLISLSAHIQFTIERTKEYGEVVNPLNYELKYIYPKEYKVAEWAVNYLRREYDLELYDSEITFFTLHFVNGLQSSGAIAEVMEVSNILGDITQIIDVEFKNNLNKESIYYSRFIVHLRYFVIRKLGEKTLPNEEIQDLYDYVSDKFVDANKIVQKVDEFLKAKYNFDFGYDENLYLLLHVQRLIDDNIKK